MLTLHATLTDGTSLAFTELLSLTLSKTLALPCDELVVSALCEVPPGELVQVILCYDDRELFTGIVDRQQHCVSAAGSILSLECRSAQAVLLDNEATPRTHYYTRLSTIVRSHAAAYGMRGVRGEDPYLSRYGVYKGFSVWRAIELFCRQTLGRAPRVTTDGYIDTSPVTPQRTLTIGNRTDGGAQVYTRLTSEINRCGVISSVKVQTRSGYYGTTVHNADAADVKRVRLLVPSAEWANLPKRSAQEIIRASMHAKRQIEVCLPGMVECEPGDRAVLCDPPYKNDTLYVGELCCRLSGDGLFTAAVLYDEKYR